MSAVIIPGNPFFVVRRGVGVFSGDEDGDYADATITVADDIATFDDGVTEWSWLVEEAGPGAPAGKIGLSGNHAVFTHDSNNYRFQVSFNGAGAATIEVTDDIATITIGATDIQWEVFEVA